jgi:cobalt-precorrin 5A hydrolase/precorrin-3B C17-methyltransferase
VSQERTWQLEKAKEILLQWRSPQTPVVLARNLGRKGETVTVKFLEDMTIKDADMRTIILVGSSKTRLIGQGKTKQWVYTPRHY